MSPRHVVRLLRALLCALLVAVLALGTLAPAQAATSRSLSVAASPTGAERGTPVTFSGRLTRSPKDSVVRIQRKDGTSWVLVRSTRTTTATGRYQVRVTLPTFTGVYAYRAVAPRKGSLARATSKTIKVAALEKTFVSIAASPSTVPAGTSTQLSGIVRPFTAGATVVIQRWSGTSWIGVATTRLDANGFYGKALTVNSRSVLRATVARAGQAAPGFSSPQTVNVTTTPPPPAKPVIGTTALPHATEGTSYGVTLTATGNPPGTWTASPLPAGLALDPATGVISGTPAVAGTTQVVVGFTQTSTGLAATPKTLALVVEPRPAPVISTTSLPDGTVLTKYAAQLTVSGNPAGTWTISGKPAWMTFNTSTGAIGGTPFGPGDYTITVGFAQTGNPTPSAPVTLTVHVNGL